MEQALPFNFPCFTSHPRSVTTFGDLTKEQMEQYKAAFTFAIEEEIRLSRPDIIHGQHVWILPSLAAGYGIPLVLTAHGTDLMGFDRWPDMQFYAQRAVEASSYVISISKDNCQLFGERFPDQKEKVVMMRNGYDPGIFYPEHLERGEVLAGFNLPEEDYAGKRIVSFAGKLARFKGVDILLEAMKLYEDKEPRTITLIVGDGDEHDALHAQAKELDLKTVRFLGNVDQQMLRKIYNIADVSLVPSRREPFGLVAIEAMACGTPVIATNQGGLADIVNEKVGALVEPEDPVDLAGTILRVLKREEETDMAAWRKEIMSYVRDKYAQDKIIRELDELYKRCM